jgi:hypothetical protein
MILNRTESNLSGDGIPHGTIDYNQEEKKEIGSLS